MGSAVSSKVSEYQLSQMKQMKNQRDMQLATSIAFSRDLVYFMSGAVGTIVLIGIVKRPFPIPAIPLVIVPTAIGYQLDTAYGTKLNRIKDAAIQIRKDESYWFNERMDLPPLLKKPYRDMMDKQNKELAAKGFPPADEWAF